MSANPAALYSIYALVKPRVKSLRPSGVYAAKPGYHNTRKANRSSDYSVQAPADRRGRDDKAAAIDLTFSASDMTKVTQRLRQACTPNGKGDYDPRIECIREFIGSLNGRDVCGFNRYRTGRRTGWYASGYSDISHRWHVHVSVFRDRVENRNDMTGLAEVICGLPRGALGWKGEGVKPEPVKYLGPYYVDPRKVSTTLRGLDMKTGKTVVEFKPGTKIYRGTNIQLINGRKWLVTDQGRRYALDFLTLTDPNK